MKSDMNQINRRQNTEPFLNLLRARSSVYESASAMQRLQLLVALILPIIAAALGFVVPESRPYVASVSLIIAVVDVCWLDRSQRARLRLAAGISERFDCTLLELSPNKFVTGRPISPEIIEGAAGRWTAGDARLENWYPNIPEVVPLELARIICQLANLWYDSELRRSYGQALLSVVVILGIVMLVVGIGLNLSTIDLVATVFVPFAPVLLWGLREQYRQRDAADANETIRNEAETLWEQALANMHDLAGCTSRSREFQDAIYSRRAANPLIFPLLYRFRRKRLETQMNRGAAARLKAAGYID